MTQDVWDFWSYGITTVPARIEDGTLAKTLASLRHAGFDNPHVFIDGTAPGWLAKFDSQVWSLRTSPVRTFGNWVLSMIELYLRSPASERFAIFQDDLLACRNLRQYLDKCTFPIGGYWNLYSCRDEEPGPTAQQGWRKSNQRGRGALGLVFSRGALLTLLSQRKLWEHPRNSKGWRGVDGAIVDSMGKAGWQEWVHNPSLLQHTGMKSQTHRDNQPIAQSFRGEEWDALELLSQVSTPPQSS